MRHREKPQGDRATARGELRVNVYALLCDVVERGVSYGWNRAHKHTSEPSEQDAKSAIGDAVLAEICEAFWWESPQD